MNYSNNEDASATVGIVVLGCDKNTADAERFAGVLAGHLPHNVSVFGLLPDVETIPPLEAVIIYTCAFIHDAKEESVETILEWCRRKTEDGNPHRVYVAGCLPQRYAKELKVEIPEVDGFFGVHEVEELLGSLCAADVKPATTADTAVRRKLDNKPYAFLKIADGCDHACTFCVIPGIKGAYGSAPREALLAEARDLVAAGIRELNLVAQDITAYGRDLYPDYRLPELLRDLCALPGDFWIRLLYCYPGGVSDALIEQMATQPKIAPYLDMPLQHVAPAILKAMKRPAAEQDIAALIARLRDAIPGLALRTTMMVGFPGETDEDFQMLLDTVRQVNFEWLGAFRFCPEAGTVAATLSDAVPETTTQERFDTLMEAQAEITARYNESREGQHARVLVEGYDEDLRAWVARSPAEAPEVDGSVLLYPHPAIRSGEFIEVEFLRASMYDITASALTQGQTTK